MLPGFLLLIATVLLVTGIASGRLAWQQATAVIAGLVGMGGLWIARIALPEPWSAIVGFTILVPALVVSARASTLSLRKSRASNDDSDARLLAAAAAASDSASALYVETEINDVTERRRRLRLRLWRMGLALPIGMATVGILRGSWSAALFGAVVGSIPALITRFLTRSLTKPVKAKALALPTTESDSTLPGEGLR